MYVITFYSYKGGAGRTMSLVNVGMHFANHGKRVLFVDFDLEAPGLASYEGAGRLAETPGLVDYVSEYLENNSAPDVNRFLTRGSVPGSGEAWFMGSGKQDDGYAEKLSAIDWAKLYQEKSGFLMFEDLRSQWESVLKPDYVLIDSRTGFSDTGGICTRQLPDAVCFVAFPTDQNLVGLERVVRSVREDTSKLPGRARDLHLVISNVPKLDDENDILATSVQRFKEKLGFDAEPTLIHHYHSLSLLRQSVFVIDRPKTELARAYVALSERLAIQNVTDRDAALRRLRAWFATDPSEPGGEPVESVLRDIEAIRNAHKEDGEVLFWLSRAHRRWGDAEKALSLLEAALAQGYTDPAARSDRVLLLFLAGRPAEAKSALRELFASDVKMGQLEVVRLVHLGRSLDVTLNLASSQLVMNSSHEDRVQIAVAALQSGMDDDADRLAKQLLTQGNLTPADVQRVRDVRGQVAIRKGRLSDAISVMNPEGANPALHTPQTAFHIAVASYWEERPDAANWMERGLLAFNDVTGSDPGSLQCKAFGLFVLNQPDLAIERLRTARKALHHFSYYSFSVWRYDTVSDEEFEADCEEMNSLFQGKKKLPRFLRKGSK